jgi:hypothetical protein
MAYDKELCLFDKATIAGGSGAGVPLGKVIDFGRASNILEDLYYTFQGTITAAGSIDIQTAADTAFTTPTVVASFPLKTTTTRLSVKLPYKGVLRYIRAFVNKSTAGTGSLNASNSALLTNKD